MVEKFEVGKFYKGRFSDVPFYVSAIEEGEVTIERADGTSFIIEPEKIRPNYYCDFTEISLKGIEKIIRQSKDKVKFFSQRLRKP